MIRKYRNEGIVLGALLLLVGGFMYQRSMNARLDSSLEQAQSASRQITEVQTLQTVWSTKGLKAKVTALHKLIPTSKIKTFEQKKKKLSMAFVGLNGKEINAVSSRIASLPLQIQKISIVRSGETYALECQCSW
jgi:hypothetical protein